MSKLFSKPKAPAAPDYTQLAKDQGAESRASAEQTAKLGSPNEVTPWGSINRQYDPTAGQFTYTTSLTPDQAKLFEGAEDIDLSLLDIGQKQLGNLSDIWSKPFDTTGMTDRVTSINPSNLKSSFDSTGYSLDTGKAPGFSTDIKGAPIRQSVPGTSYQKDPGSAASYQAALDLGKLGKRPTLDYSALPALPGVGDFGGERDKVEEALYTQQSKQLDPQWQQREEKLRNRLYSQGIREGNPAWNRAFEDLNRERTSAYESARMSSITGAGAEQSRLFGMASTARNQAAQEALASAGFELDSRSQGVAEALAEGNFANAVTQLERQYGLDRQTATNAATQLQNSFDLASAQFSNNAQGQEFDEELARTSVRNTAAQLEREYGLDKQSALNAAIQLQNQLGLQKSTFSNTAEQQRFDQDLENALLANRSRGEEMDEAAFKRSLPFNELSAILQGTAPQAPQFGGPTVAPGVSGAPLYQAGQDAYTSAYNQYAQEMAALNNLWSTIGNVGSAVGGGLAGRGP